MKLCKHKEGTDTSCILQNVEYTIGGKIMALFEGSGVAIVTPFHDDYSVNFKKLHELVNWHIENGTDSIIICGTTGEASTLDDAEHLECIRVAVEATKKRVPVIAGTGSNDTRHGINLSKEAQKLGVDGLLQVTPYYNKTSQKGLVAHFKAIASSVDIPIMLYSVPSRTTMRFSTDTLVTLSKVENIVAIKEASGDVSHIIEYMNATEGRLDLYSGNDDQIVTLLGLGGKGVISVVANILPKETHDIVALYMEGKKEESLHLQMKMLPLIQSLFTEANPIPVKAAMNLMHKNVGSLRLPLIDITEPNLEKVRREMTAYGMI